MSEFAVGEIAILAYDRRPPSYAGQEVTITGILNGTRHDTKAKYKITTADGVEWSARADQLRKKPPKEKQKEKTTTWDKCIWRPAGVSA